MRGQQDFAARLRQLVRDAERGRGYEIDRGQLARKLHVSPQSLYAYLSGATMPPTRTLAALLTELGAPESLRDQLARERDELIETRRGSRRSAPKVGAPQQLPQAVPGFTGREADLATLDRLRAKGCGLVVISGTAGVGKTATAVQWAHRVAHHFPDGQLFVDLRGYDPGQPLTATEALGAFLRALGISGAEIPPGEAESAALFRTLLAAKRMLILLDNAGDAAQARPLLPGTATSMVLVTSRDRLGGLVAREGAERLILDLLWVLDAAALILALTSGRGVTEQQARELADKCARLPLALRIAAELIVSQPHTPIPELIAGLGDELHRLDLLDTAGDDRTAARSVFSWSYGHLPDPVARAFRLIGLAPSAELDAYECAALFDTDVPAAASIVDQLRQAHLAMPMHDLLRAYAAELVNTVDPPRTREAALVRLFDYYRFCATAAVRCLFPAEVKRLPELCPPATPVPDLSQRQAAQSWLDIHRELLLIVVRQAARLGLWDHVKDFANALNRYFVVLADYPAAVTLGEHGLRVAQQLGDVGAQIGYLLDLGALYGRWRRHDEATPYLEKGLELARNHGHIQAQARALGALGNLHWSVRGEYQLSADCFQQALALAQQVGDEIMEGKIRAELGAVFHRTGRFREALETMRAGLEIQRKYDDRFAEAVVTANIGIALVYIGREPEAIEYLTGALKLQRDVGNRVGEGVALLNLGIAHVRLGDATRAASFLRQGLRIHRKTGDRVNQAHALDQLGILLSRAGAHDKAIAHHERALSILGELGNRSLEAMARTNFGLTLLGAGEIDRALRQINDALAWLGETREPLQEALANEALARVHAVTGDRDESRRRWRRAEEIYTRLDLPVPDYVRTALLTTDAPGTSPPAA